jgi:hypothetical protein
METARKTANILMAIAMGIILDVTAAACRPTGIVLNADLAVSFHCKDAPSEPVIESFLRDSHFEVANLERARRQRNRGAFSLEIEAVDQRHWMITVRGLPLNPMNQAERDISYNLSVNSPPPTHHDEKFENSILVFISDQLHCRIVSNEHHDNPASAAGFFEEILASQKSRMHEAEVCDKTVSTYDASECAKVPGVSE